MNENNAKILMSFTTRVTGVRILNRTMIPTFWDVTAEFFSVLDNDQSPNESNVAYNVLYFWINELMDDLLVYDAEDDFGKELARISANAIVTTPGSPTDDLMVQLLHCKMNAIAGDCLGILKLSLKADDSDLEYQYVDFLGGDSLPGMAYAGDILTAHSDPWWRRNTSDCCDIPLVKETDNITELDSDLQKKDVLDRYRDVLRTKFDHGMVGDIDTFVFDTDLGLDLGNVETGNTVAADPEFVVQSTEDESNIIEIPKD